MRNNLLIGFLLTYLVRPNYLTQTVVVRIANTNLFEKISEYFSQLLEGLRTIELVTKYALPILLSIMLTKNISITVFRADEIYQPNLTFNQRPLFIWDSSRMIATAAIKCTK